MEMEEEKGKSGGARGATSATKNNKQILIEVSRILWNHVARI